MATTYLPRGFQTREAYLESALRLLCQYEWLFNWPVTKILSCGVLDELPLEWWEPLQRLSLKNLNELPRGVCDERWPLSLRGLVAACAALRLPVADLPLPLATHLGGNLRHALRKGMTPKKVHEVTHLAAVIHEQCAAAHVKCVVDMGSGHGYLCEVLHHAYGYRVLGLESVPARVLESRRRHEDICRALGVAVSNRVRYLECDVSADNPAPIAAALAEEVDDEGRPLPFCLVGLHSCGDLTPHALRLFQGMEQIKSMVLVACCYHRMGVAPAPPHCQTHSPGGPGRRGGRPGERQGKVKRVLEWHVRRWSRERDHHGEDLGELVRLAVQWLGPRGPLLQDRAPGDVDREHFFNFPLSASLRRLTHCGQPQPWSTAASPSTASSSTTSSLTTSSLTASSLTASSLTASSLTASSLTASSTTASSPSMASSQPTVSSSSTASSSTASTLTASSSTASSSTASSPLTASSSTASSPLTASLSTASSPLTACAFLRRPMLRLAAQETVERWEQMTVETHQRHSRHVMARAVFEVYAVANGIQPARRGSRCLRGAALSLDARAVLAEMVQRLVPAAAAEEVALHRKALCTLYAALEPLRPLLEALTALQSALQNVCEGLVLVDRLAVLAEAAEAAGDAAGRARTVSVVKVADQLFTPRCYALVASK